MKTWLLLGLLVGASLVGVTLIGVASVGAEEGEIADIDWLTDLEAAREQAREEERPLLVVFR